LTDHETPTTAPDADDPTTPTSENEPVAERAEDEIQGPAPATEPPPPDHPYDAAYYAHYYTRGGPDLPYERTPEWLGFFGQVAERIVAEIAPATALDVGCAHSFLVESLRDRGVDAKGFDISEFAISQAREDLRPHVWVGSLLDPIPGHYDLVTCIEVLEHVEDRDAATAIANLCAVTDDVVFTSSPDDYREETHVNVRALEYWSELFARQGMVRDIGFDGSFLTWWAARFRRRRDPWPRVIGEYERHLWRLEVEAHHRNTMVIEQMREIQRLAHEEVAPAVSETPLPEAVVTEAVSETPLPEAVVTEAVSETPLPEAVVAEPFASGVADEEEWTRLEEMGLALARTIADRVDQTLTEVDARLSERIDKALAEVDARQRERTDQVVMQLAHRRRTGVRHYIRTHTPLWFRRLVMRGVHLIWWSLTLQLPRRLRERRDQLSDAGARVLASPPSAGELVPTAPDVGDTINERLRLFEAVATYVSLSSRRSVSVLTGDLGAAGLRGGVGAAVMIGALVAERTETHLRLVTRARRADAARVAELLEQNGLEVPLDMEVIHVPPASGDSLPVAAGDAFLTTSWRETRALLAGVRADRVIQVVEDDERERYGLGDDRLGCAETLSDPNQRLLIYGHTLFTELSEGKDPLPGLAARAAWFEPAFPAALYHDDPSRRGGSEKRSFLLCVDSPSSERLYGRALKAVAQALEDGTLNDVEWRFTFLGSGLEPIRLPGAGVPTILDDLAVRAYADVLRSTDLALSLTGTAHSGLAAARLVASGAVVVCGVRETLRPLDEEMGNVILSGSSLASLSRSLAVGTALARDESSRAANCARLNLERDWRASLEAAVKRCAEWMQS
jgi:hypothetical protein